MDYEMRKGSFLIQVDEGDSASIGRARARALRERRGAYFDFLTGHSGAGEPLRGAAAAAFEGAAERACPGIMEEAAAFAAEAGIAPAELLFARYSALKGAACTHAIVPAELSADGRSRVLRSYEWNPAEDDLCLRITRKAGRKAHIGCAVLAFGLLEGMNEDGLCVTISGGMAAGLPAEWKYRDGLNFWVPLRGMLENCASAAEALEWLRANQPAGNTIFLLADAAGGAFRAEVLRGELREDYIDADAVRGPHCAAATNHYVLPATRPGNRPGWILDASAPRLAAVEAFLEAKGPGIGEDALLELAARPAPSGCFAPWYSQGFGTLWACIFEPSTARVKYCLGAPGYNEWSEFSLYAPEGVREREVVFPEAKG